MGYIGLNEIQWNEVATSTARNFNNNWPLYLKFPNMVNLRPIIWSIQKSKFQQFLIWKESCQKNTNFPLFYKAVIL